MNKSLTLTACAGLLLVAGTANAGEIWKIGLEDNSRLEFYPDGGGTLLAGCPFVDGVNSGSGEFVVGVNVDGDFPQFFETIDATSTFWRARSCRDVTIKFSLEEGCANPKLTYRRFGGEIIDVLFNDEVVLDDTQVALNTANTFVADIGGILMPGEYEVAIQPQSNGGDDGYAATDFIKLECDILVGYGKVSGRVDDPFLTDQRGRGMPLYTFQGFLGLTEYGETVGSVSVNYKALGDQCEFTGGTLSFPANLAEPYARLDNAVGTCAATTINNATIAIYDRSWPGPSDYCTNATGRGCFGLNVRDSSGTPDLTSPYRIAPPDPSDPQNYSADIDAGNGIVMEPTP